MLILLPPSEGKFAPARGRRLDLEGLSFPSLSPTRARLISALAELCRHDPTRAQRVLGLSEAQAGEVARNAGICGAPTAPAARIYTGVLYDALGFASLSTAAKRRAATRVAVCSALFGLLRPGDHIPSYRLPGNTSLPGVGGLARTWRGPISDVLSAHARRELLVDLRSSTYAAYGLPPAAGGLRVVTVRVLQDRDGVRSVVSHFNKATKGRLVASLLEDGLNPRSPAALAAGLAALGWRAEASVRRGAPTVDVVVTELS